MNLRLPWRAWTAIGVLMAVIASAVPASAQGLYYKEIEKDGRIYVFNIAADARALFEQSGEMGVGITQARRRPEGRNRRRRLRARAAAVLLQARHLRSRAGADAAGAAHRRGATARPASRRTSRISKSPTAFRRATRTNSPTICHRFCAGTARRRRFAGLVPHPAREVEARRLVLGPARGGALAADPAQAVLRGAVELGGARRQRRRAAGQRRRRPRRRQHRLGSAGHGQVPRRLRSVQGAVRAAAADLVRQPAVRRSLARVGRIRARPRHRRRRSRARSGATSSSTAPACSTATD